MIAIDFSMKAHVIRRSAINVLPQSAVLRHAVVVVLVESPPSPETGVWAKRTVLGLNLLHSCQGLVQRQDPVQVVLVQQVAPCMLVLKEAAIEAVLPLASAQQVAENAWAMGFLPGFFLPADKRFEVSGTPASDKIPVVGVVLNVPYDVAFLDFRVVEVVRSVTERVDLELLEVCAGAVREKPVEYDAALQTALRVQDKYHLLLFIVGKSSGDECVACPSVDSAVIEASL